MSNNDGTCFSLAEQINIVLNLPEAGHHLKSDAKIAADRIAREAMRHAQEMLAIREQFQMDVWSIVEKNWTPKELEDANT